MYDLIVTKKKNNKSKVDDNQDTIHIEQEASDENEELPKKRKKISRTAYRKRL